MQDKRSFARRQAARLTGLLLIAGAYGFARQPLPDEGLRRALAARFRFAEIELPGPAATRHVRAVHPQIEHISAWISSVGAGAALADLDGDGLANELCLVETRSDEVRVLPVPGVTRPRPADYAPFTLRAPAEMYDAGFMAPMGCLPADLDEDGRSDVIVYYWGRPPIAFMRRGATLAADAFMAVELGPRAETWYTNAGTRADLDGDGHVDLAFGNYFQDGARVLVPPGVDPGVRHVMQDSMTRAFNGGRKHLFLCRPVLENEAGFACAAQDDFLDVADAELRSRVVHGWTLAMGTADLDGDLLPEIYCAHDFGPDRLLVNRSRPGRLRFTLAEGERGWGTPASRVLGRDSYKGMGVDFGDVNGDGRPDLYVSNITSRWALQESQYLFVSQGDVGLLRRGVAPYVDRGESLGVARSGWSWDARLADFDNDGALEALQATGFVKGEIDRWPELQEMAMGNDQLLHRPASWLSVRPGDDLSGREPNPFFTRDAQGRFVDVAAQLGLAAPRVTRALALGDVDGDGDLDYVTGNQWDASYFYRNDSPAAHAFLSLRLLRPLVGEAEGTTEARAGFAAPDLPGTPAIGASVAVLLPDGHGLAPFLPRLTRLVAQVDGGNGHSGKRSPELHFGLGTLPRDRALVVELRWRGMDGSPRCERLKLQPGWHSVRLGRGEQGDCHVG